jgi:hypothetical protein
MASLPYITAPGNIERALSGIKAAATPERVTQDFVKTILKIPGGSGDQITSYLRKLGFANSDGTPSDIYKKFRNPATSGRAAAEALKVGYSALYKHNEFMHALNDDELKGLVIQVTGAGGDSSVADLIVKAITAVKKLAAFDVDGAEESREEQKQIASELPIPSNTRPPLQNRPAKLGMNLSYTINLNLPATSDVAVFNAIFKSLKEHLLRDTDEV